MAQATRAYVRPIAPPSTAEMIRVTVVVGNVKISVRTAKKAAVPAFNALRVPGASWEADLDWVLNLVRTSAYPLYAPIRVPIYQAAE